MPEINQQGKEIKIMEQEKSLQRKEDEGLSVSAWQIFSGVVLILSGLLIILSLPDIKRYIKITRM